jgi:excinuclease ABC subunit C
MKKCLAPCGGKINKKSYQGIVNEISLFLRGEQERLIKRLEKKMGGVRKALKFEEAILLRNQIYALKKLSEKQKVVSSRPLDQDVIACAAGSDEACGYIFFIRKGKLIGGDYFFLGGIRNKSRKEILTSLVKQYYYNAAYIPREVVLQNAIEDKKLIGDYLENKGGRKIKLTVPQKGNKLRLIKLAARNAHLMLTRKYSTKQTRIERPLLKLEEVLGLKKYPFHIEAFDISNISGTLATGSLVVFKDGRPEKSEYRRFRVKRIKRISGRRNCNEAGYPAGGGDDCAMMAEVLGRRYRRLVRQKKGLPDLILVDGGKGQLSASLKVLERLKLKVPVVALAKRYEHLFLPSRKKPVILPRDSGALYLLKEIRDEAHRFALAYHKKLRTKKITRD